MVVNGHREHLLGVLLADDVVVEVAEDVAGAGHGEFGERGEALLFEFFIEDVLADDDAGIADVNARSSDQLFDFRVAFTTEGAHCDVRGAGHRRLIQRPEITGNSLRLSRTLSTNP